MFIVLNNCCKDAQFDIQIVKGVPARDQGEAVNFVSAFSAVHF